VLRSRRVGHRIGIQFSVAGFARLLQTVNMTRFLLALVLTATLAGCGFHLRNKLMLPADTAAVKVVSTAPYSELAKLLRRGLQASGATLADADSKEPAAQLQVLSERWGDLPIAIDAQGRAQEFSLRYAVIFVFRREDGSDLVPQQVIELSRDYVSPPTDSTGTTTEREILADELRREMSASIMRRIDSVVRAELERGRLNPPAKPTADPAAAPAGVPSTAPSTTPPAAVPAVKPPQGG
jgi:LPS-assembly lipoprotein